jgi:GNAT superfamily N-acetyltransferase
MLGGCKVSLRFNTYEEFWSYCFGLCRDFETNRAVVYTYPSPTCFGRRMILPKMNMRELNQKLSIISRVVDPKYRTIGLGHKLIRETLEQAGTPYVEAVAVMAQDNAFFEYGELRKIAESPPVKSAFNIAEVLSKSGFNITVLRSPKYVLKKLPSLSPEELSIFKEAFAENKHPRFMKEFNFRAPCGRTKFFEALETAGLKNSRS